VKQNNSKKIKNKSFLRIPEFPGGKEAYLQFVKENIKYPDQALANKIEGLVYVKYKVNNIGEVLDVEVTKGIGYGCDEEAVRVIRMMSYEPARNRGVKMKAEMKTRIHFKLPEIEQPVNQEGIQLSYLISSSQQIENPEPKPRVVYNYSIKLE